MKKNISFIVTLGLILTLVPNMGEMKEVHAYSYNVDAAIAYAQAHWDDNVGKCAEFVSRCVQAGGINISVEAVTSNCFNAISNATGVQGQWLNLESNGYASEAKNSSILQRGDVVISWCDQGHSPWRPHIMLCGGYKNGYASFYAHNYKHNNDVIPANSGTCEACGRRANKAQVLHISNSDRHPEGFLDSVVSESPGTIRVRGWAYDPDRVTESIKVHVYIGGSAGDSNAEGHEISTNAYREDVDDALHIGGWHGFDTTIKTNKKGSQPVYVYGIDMSQSGNNNELNNSGVKVNITPDLPPVIKNVRVTNISSGGYDVYCEVYDDSGIEKVEMPTWTAYNGQDDLASPWQVAELDGNIARFHVDTSEHNNETGLYHTHIYAWDKNGNSSSSSNNYTILVPIDYDDQINKSLVQSTYYNGHTYNLYKLSLQKGDGTDRMLRWSEANHLSEAIGGHLVSITSSEENSIVADLTKDYGSNCWIGATDENIEGLFKWKNGEDFTYDNWDEGEPNNNVGYVSDKPENYVAIRSNGYWNDCASDNYLAFICEFDYDLDINHYNIEIEDENNIIYDGKEKTPLIRVYSDNKELVLDKDYVVEYNDNIFAGTAVAIITGKGVFKGNIKKEFIIKSPVIPVTDVNITDDIVSANNIYEGDVIQLSANVLPENATDKTIVWESSNSEVATVSDSGLDNM